MAAIIARKIQIIGSDVCGVCFLRDDCTKRKNGTTGGVQAICIPCFVVEFNKEIEKTGIYPVMHNEDGRRIEVSRAERGKRAGEIWLYERIKVIGT